MLEVIYDQYELFLVKIKKIIINIACLTAGAMLS